MALFNIQEERRSSGGTAFVAKPGSYNATSRFVGNGIQATRLSAGGGSSSVINVFDSFDWSTTPYPLWNQFKSMIPRVYMTEYKLSSKSMLLALRYYVSATISAGNSNVSTITDVKTLISTLKDIVAGNNVEEPKSTPIPSGSGDGPLSPYEGLYNVNETGFQYVLPYFDDAAFNDVQSSYSDAANPVIGAAGEGAQRAAAISRILTGPGAYIEKPQFFTPGTNFPYVNIQFPLINTISYESAVNNYQFLSLLTFQNLPQRITKVNIDFPCIYDVRVLGGAYFNYAYVESLNVKFLGNRRVVQMNSPLGNTEAIMPDAYAVSITMKSLVASSSNLLIAGARKK